MVFGLYTKLISKYKKYKPYEYWYKRGKKYQDNFEYSEFFKLQEKTFLDVLKELSFDTVLEFGCGFGRMTKLVLENFQIKKYVAFDLSPTQIQNAQKLCNSFDVEFHVSTIEGFKYKEKFDLVFGSEVLLHVLPSEIHHVVNHLINHSKKYMVNIDYFPEINPKYLAKHNFIHSYKKIYLESEKVHAVKVARINEKQCIFNACLSKI